MRRKKIKNLRGSISEMEMERMKYYCSLMSVEKFWKRKLVELINLTEIRQTSALDGTKERA